MQHLRYQMLEFFVRDGTRRRAAFNPLPRTVPLKGLYRVLICQPEQSEATLLLLMPLIAEIQDRFPGTQIDLVVAGEAASRLFRGFPNVGQIYALPSKARRHPWSFLRTIQSLRQQRYDLAIDPDLSSQLSRLLTIHCRANHRIGFDRNESSAKLTCAMPLLSLNRDLDPLQLFRWALPLSDTSLDGRLL